MQGHRRTTAWHAIPCCSASRARRAFSWACSTTTTSRKRTPGPTSCETASSRCRGSTSMYTTKPVRAAPQYAGSVSRRGWGARTRRFPDVELTRLLPVAPVDGVVGAYDGASPTAALRLCVCSIALAVTRVCASHCNAGVAGISTTVTGGLRKSRLLPSLPVTGTLPPRRGCTDRALAVPACCGHYLDPQAIDVQGCARRRC